MRILIADRDPLARLALRTALAGEPGMDEPLEATDAEQARKLAERHPDVALVDAELPGMEVGRLVAELAEQHGIRVLVISALNLDESRLENLQTEFLTAGASGFIDKSIDVAALPRICRSVTAGEAVISRVLTMRLIERYRQLARSRRGLRPLRSPLTSREWEIVGLMRDGASTREIARALGLSANTVYSHVKHVFRKLDVHTRAEAVEAAEQLRGTVSV